MAINNLAQAVGRRKTAVARVYLRKGSGKIQVNKQQLDVYFPIESQRTKLQNPLRACDAGSSFDIYINVSGGGKSGQVGACVHGIARALVAFSEENRGALHSGGLLTRDPRMVERKKYGQRGARRSFQFSKR
ncbi:30S ribosomal protein S9 [Candidatus Haliotispira prima]|uniref:Small ribosomal subunit protein uS9 n=1 Tax=Candidatus Haliotispira prima TaxID=3034016 RepID=A0ABY8MF50_9SPIO|nr:30S ribosomal protein S9 [Candidatus Haliotispira prima]